MTHPTEGRSDANGLTAWFQRHIRKSARSKGAAPANSPSTTESAPATITSSPFGVRFIMKDYVQPSETRAVTVFCGSSTGTQEAFKNAAISLGKALAAAERPLVYGGGSMGIMGAVSGAVLEGGGDVTGVVPFAMVAAGGEVDKTKGNKVAHVLLKEPGREKVDTIVVNSMHERKAEMARRSCGFFGLPGGYGTFEEVLEVACWSQIGIHSKPVIVLNVLNFWEPLRTLIKSGVSNGFIRPKNENLIRFVDGPADLAEHTDFDWGKAALEALESWQSTSASYLYNWTLRKDGEKSGDNLGAA